MYAVIRSGGKQYRVEQGQQLDVERLGDAGTDVELTPVLVVDGDRVLATPEQLGGATVSARVVDSVRAPKIIGFTYKSKSNQRKRWGHRQHQSRIEITAISAGGSRKATATEKAPAEDAPAKKATAKKSPAKKTTAKKSPAKKSPAKKSPAKKSPAKRSPAKKGTG